MFTDNGERGQESPVLVTRRRGEGHPDIRKRSESSGDQLSGCIIRSGKALMADTTLRMLFQGRKVQGMGLMMTPVHHS